MRREPTHSGKLKNHVFIQFRSLTPIYRSKVWISTGNARADNNCIYTILSRLYTDLSRLTVVLNLFTVTIELNLLRLTMELRNLCWPWNQMLEIEVLWIELFLEKNCKVDSRLPPETPIIKQQHHWTSSIHRGPAIWRKVSSTTPTNKRLAQQFNRPSSGWHNIGKNLKLPLIDTNHIPISQTSWSLLMQ
jgi:hypothetical protein